MEIVQELVRVTEERGIYSIRLYIVRHTSAVCHADSIATPLQEVDLLLKMFSVCVCVCLSLCHKCVNDANMKIVFTQYMNMQGAVNTAGIILWR